MSATVADVLVDQMVEAGIRSVYGVVGDSANPIVDAIRRHPSEIEFVHVRNEEAGAMSPTYHPAFSTPLELTDFIAQLRELSGGKPIGFKICIGDPREYMAILKAMIETDTYVDFVVVDGGEGGTGAAPLEFSNAMGAPLREGLTVVQNGLVGAGLRDRIKVGASGKLVTAAKITTALALGADRVNSARGFMMSERVHNFHRNTIHAVAEMITSAGMDHPSQLTPRGPAR